MKIARAIMATDANPAYFQFWSVVAPRWRQWGIMPTLAVINDKKLDIDESLGEVIYVKPDVDIHSSHQAQIVRLFLAAHYRDDVCLISDIDMMPLKKEYFVDIIEEYEKDAFVVYSADAYAPGDPAFPAFPMCYLCSTGENFYNIIDGDLDNFHSKAKEWMGHGFGWHTDEKVFYRKFMDWMPREKKGIFFRRGFNVSSDPLSIGRIDRGNACHYREDLLEKGFYIDFHMPRPYSSHKEVIDLIFEKTNLGDPV